MSSAARNRALAFAVLAAFALSLCAGLLHHAAPEGLSHVCSVDDAGQHLASDTEHHHPLSCDLCSLQQELREVPRVDAGDAPAPVFWSIRSQPGDAVPDDAALFAFRTRGPPSA